MPVRILKGHLDLVRADAILPLVNGRRSLKAILRASIYPRFSTMRAVHKLLSLGYVKARDREGQTVPLALAPVSG